MKLSITELSAEDRPREKFMAHGAKALSKAELLAILIGSGNADENAVQLMQRVLADYGDSLAALQRQSVETLCTYKGVGPAKAVTILAACSLAARCAEEDNRVERIGKSEDIYHYFCHRIGNLSHEESHVLLLNHQLCVVGARLISRGGITGTVVDIRMVLKEALLANATRIALCHNHPSGSLKPSRDDDALTERLRKAAEAVDIRLIDHVIVTAHGYYSYADEQRL